MLAVMNRIRLVILTDDEVRTALKVEASARGVEMSDLAALILREALADALKMVRSRQSTPKKGRKETPLDAAS
jgi:hypothetical protein